MEDRRDFIGNRKPDGSQERRCDFLSMKAKEGRSKKISD
jgi:hypothetical protein